MAVKSSLTRVMAEGDQGCLSILVKTSKIMTGYRQKVKAVTMTATRGTMKTMRLVMMMMVMVAIGRMGVIANLRILSITLEI